MGAPHVIVIGAGSTGAAIAHDLALRGPRADHVLRWALALVGAATVGYGLDLTLAVIR